MEMSFDEGKEKGWEVRRKFLKKRSKNLKRDEKVHNCDQFDSKCKAKQKLNVHKKVKHVENSTNECDMCQKNVNIKPDLVEHIQSQHEES